MKLLKKILQILIPLALAGLLFWLVYKDMDFSRLSDVFRSGLNYGWILLSVLLSILSMVIRGLRWKQLMDPVCPGGSLKNIILSIFTGYMANLLVPRAGEVARCGVINKTDGVSFSKSLGTVITERVFDMLCLILMTIFAFFAQMDVFENFFTKNPSSVGKLAAILTSPVLWGTFAVLILAIVIMSRHMAHFSFYLKLKGFVKKLWEGMKSISAIKHPALFIFYTILIWGIYFLMFYIGKYFFPFAVPLGALAMLSGFIMGSYGVVAPVQGGIGAYHFMVIFTFTFYGMQQSDAEIFALVIHGLQTVTTLVTGFIAYMWIVMETKKTKSQNSKID